MESRTGDIFATIIDSVSSSVDASRETNNFIFAIKSMIARDRHSRDNITELLREYVIEQRDGGSRARAPMR